MLKKRLVFLYGYAVFSLSVFVTGSIAWFAANSKVNATDMEVKVATAGCELSNLHLYKFDYYHEILSENDIFYDYFHPENGSVEKYEYNRDLNLFGYYEDESFVSVDGMNLYDPLESLITGSELKDLNTNVIYEIQLHFATPGTVPVCVFANSFEVTKPNASDIFCSTCMDFDVFTEADLNDINLTEDKYKPEYIDDELNSNQELYFKISYLSSLLDSHSNFYKTSTQKVVIFNDSIETDLDGYATLYLNINYSPETLTSFEDIAGLQTINIICDYRLMIESGDNHHE